MTTAEHTFSAARRGYDRTQVDAQLDVLSTQLRAPTSARQSALAQVEALARKLEAGIGDIQIRPRRQHPNYRAEVAERTARTVAALGPTIPHSGRRVMSEAPPPPPPPCHQAGWTSAVRKRARAEARHRSRRPSGSWTSLCAVC
jgi:cell division septum initiation protein DivIVA